MIQDGAEEYFIICKRRMICKGPSLKAVIFIAFATYYSFNLEYPKQCREILTFMQNYLLQSPDSNKRRATYLSISTDINNYASSYSIAT